MVEYVGLPGVQTTPPCARADSQLHLPQCDWADSQSAAIRSRKENVAPCAVFLRESWVILTRNFKTGSPVASTTPPCERHCPRLPASLRCPKASPRSRVGEGRSQRRDGGVRWAPRRANHTILHAPGLIHSFTFLRDTEPKGKTWLLVQFPCENSGKSLPEPYFTDPRQGARLPPPPRHAIVTVTVCRLR